ncbi:hypothetical protein DH2020_017119 [Rehmannia glutinosa]|uniref:Pectinesterase inhibitor domain-containing protein n=1 Tax=Rehmannia glutinosa TaxID=99300 RepID=A0ABR0WTG2_REHGL
MATIFNNVPLLLTLTVLCCFLPSPPFISAAAANKTELATQICKNTTDFNFCRQIIYSDPRAPTADRVAVDTEILKGLQNCLTDYNEAIDTMAQVLRDLLRNKNHDFDKASLKAQSRVSACEKGFNGRSPITKGNVDLIKLTNICSQNLSQMRLKKSLAGKPPSNMEELLR